MSSPNQLSFLPDDYLERKARRRTNLICAVLFLICVSGMVSTIVVADRTLRQARQINDAASKEFAEAAKPIQQFQQLQEKQRTMAHQAELTASLLEKVPRSFLLAELTNSMPAGVSLLALTLDSKVRAAAPAPVAQTTFEKKKAEAEAKKGVTAPPQPKRYDVHLKLTGIALTDVQVAQFISKLNQSRLLKDVNLLISDEHVQGTDKVRKFEIEMALNPNAEVQPAERDGGGNETQTVELSATEAGLAPAEGQ